MLRKTSNRPARQMITSLVAIDTRYVLFMMMRLSRATFFSLPDVFALWMVTEGNILLCRLRVF